MTESSGFWSNDPSGKHGQRFWDGRSWTAHVAGPGFTAFDPLPPNGVTHLPPQLQRLPAPAASYIPFADVATASEPASRRRGWRMLAAGWAVALTVIGIGVGAARWGGQVGRQPVVADGFVDAAGTSTAAGLATTAAPAPVAAAGSGAGPIPVQPVQQGPADAPDDVRPATPSQPASPAVARGMRAAGAVPAGEPVPPDSQAVAGEPSAPATPGTGTTTSPATATAAAPATAPSGTASTGTGTGSATTSPGPTASTAPVPGTSATAGGYPDCAALAMAFPHGVGRSGAVDAATTGAPVTTFTVDEVAYLANQVLDTDADGIACERS